MGDFNPSDSLRLLADLLEARGRNNSSHDIYRAANACRTLADLLTWNPIETAPQDGSRVMVTGGGLKAEVEVATYNERIGCWNCETCTLDDRDDEAEGYSRPLFWKPLPTSPVTP